MKRPGVAASPEIGGIAVSGDQKNVAVISRAADLASPDRGDRRRVQRRFRLRHRQDAGRPRGDADDRNRVGARSFPCRRRHPGDVRGRDIAGNVGRHEPDGRRDVRLHVGERFARRGQRGAPRFGRRGGRSRRRRLGRPARRQARGDARAGAVQHAGRPGAPVPASTSAATKYYPHLVFDGAAFAVAWLEGSSAGDSQIMLRRFDTNLTPVGAPFTVGSAGAVGTRRLRHRRRRSQRLRHRGGGGDLDAAAVLPSPATEPVRP